MSSAKVLPMPDQPGDVLSPSTANTFLFCAAKWFFRKVRKLPDPPSGALTLGSSVHDAITENLAQKVETREDLPWEGVRAIYNDCWDKRVRGGKEEGWGKTLPTEFREDENPEELRKQGEELTKLYLEQHCPKIEPAAVEIQVAGRIGGVMVRGYIDVMDASGRIIDLKTAAKAPSKISSDYRFQVATYVKLTPGASGQAHLDTLTKTKVPKCVSQDFAVSASDMASVEVLYPAVQGAIRAGNFLPSRSSNMCSRKYCAFWRACQEAYGGEVAE